MPSTLPTGAPAHPTHYRTVKVVVELIDDVFDELAEWAHRHQLTPAAYIEDLVLEHVASPLGH